MSDTKDVSVGDINNPEIAPPTEPTRRQLFRKVGSVVFALVVMDVMATSYGTIANCGTITGGQFVTDTDCGTINSSGKGKDHDQGCGTQSYQHTDSTCNTKGKGGYTSADASCSIAPKDSSCGTSNSTSSENHDSACQHNNSDSTCGFRTYNANDAACHNHGGTNPTDNT